MSKTNTFYELNSLDLHCERDADLVTEIFYKLCATEQHINSLNHILRDHELNIHFKNPSYLGFALFCSANGNAENTIKTLLDFAHLHSIELSIEDVSAAFNCANQNNYASIINLLDDETNIISKSLGYARDRENIAKFISESIKSVRRATIFILDDIDLFFTPHYKQAQRLLNYYNQYDPFHHACLQDHQDKINRLLNSNGNLEFDVLEFNFISSSNKKRAQSVIALISHPKSRALINLSQSIKLYLSTQHPEDKRNDIKNQALILLEHFNLENQISFDTQKSEKTKKSLKI